MKQTRISRRNFVKGFAGSVALLAHGGLSSQHKVAAVDRKPNIIFIMTDDLGYGDLGCYGQKNIQTPSIDCLANEGMLFTQCYAGSTICAPSRNVLMTGQHTGHTRVRGNFGIVGGVGPQRRVPLEPEDVTVAQMLKDAGYSTCMTGKWGLAEPDTTGVPNKKGFDEWFGYLNQRNAHSYYPPYLWRNEEKFILQGNQDEKQEEYSHDMFAEFAFNFIRVNKDRPFFLYLPWCIPHARYEIPSIEPYEDKPWEHEAKVHAAMITRMDSHVGMIMSSLKELGIDEQTIVFFCSDNGAAQRWEGIFDSSGPLRGKKGDLYEGGIRTPMIVRWPNRVPAGVVSDKAWYFADFLPTAVELASVELPSNIDGISILPTLLGDEQDLENRFLYWEHFGGGFQQAVRIGDWKALRLAQNESLELYDLSKDIGEQNNVAAEQTDVVEKIESYLKSARTESKNWPTPEVK